ncbi:13585_t:CDS:2, partial [Dentiscutata heterogama]
YLLLLYESTQLLTKKMIQNIDCETCKDRKKLETLLLNEHKFLGLKELVYLLEPFAKATSLMSRDTYSTVSLMLPTIATLQEHLFEVESILTHLVVCNVRNKIELNIASQWEDPVIEGYLASILDPRFKNLEFVSEKFNETKISLKQQMRMLLDENKYLDDQPTAKPSPNLASFFNNATPTKKFSPIDTELKTYFNLPQMILYDLDDLDMISL